MNELQLRARYCERKKERKKRKEKKKRKKKKHVLSANPAKSNKQLHLSITKRNRERKRMIQIFNITFSIDFGESSFSQIEVISLVCD